jgi:hypothetical protein
MKHTFSATASGLFQILISITVEFQMLVLLFFIYGNPSSVGQKTNYHDPDYYRPDFYTVQYNESINCKKFSHPEKGGRSYFETPE